VPLSLVFRFPLAFSSLLQRFSPANVYSMWMWVWQVHGAFAGYSGITVGICNTHYVYLPIPEVISYPRLVDPNSRMWHRCL